MKYKIRREVDGDYTGWIVYPPPGHNAMKRYMGWDHEHGYGYGFSEFEIALLALTEALEEVAR